MSKRGFTLVEMLIALGVFSLIVASVFSCLGTQTRLWQKSAQTCQQNQIVSAVLINIVRDIRSSSAVLTASNQDQLILQVGADTIEYCLSLSKVKRRKNNSSAYLTEENQVKGLSFFYPQNKLIKIVADNYSLEAYVRN